MAVTLSPSALTTLDNLKESLGIATIDTSQDDRLKNLINRATAKIEQRTERKLKARRYNNAGSTHATTGVSDEDYIYFNGSTRDKGGDTDVDDRGRGVFYLPAWPIRANDEANSVAFGLATLSDRGSSVSGGEAWGTDDLVEWDDYVLDRPNGVLTLLNGRFVSGQRNYRITCAAGLLTGVAQPYVPGDLEDLCITLAKSLYREDASITSEKLGTWSRSYDPKAAKEEIEEGIAAYRRWSL